MICEKKKQCWQVIFDFSEYCLKSHLEFSVNSRTYLEGKRSEDSPQIHKMITANRERINCSLEPVEKGNQVMGLSLTE